MLGQSEKKRVNISPQFFYQHCMKYYIRTLRVTVVNNA